MNPEGETLEEENKKYLDTLIKHSKEKAGIAGRKSARPRTAKKASPAPSSLNSRGHTSNR